MTQIHFVASSAAKPIEDLFPDLQRGDIVLFYPLKLKGGQLAIHLYQNYRGYTYFDNLCTHAAIVRDKNTVVDAIPGVGVSVRSLNEICTQRLVRVRRFINLTPKEKELLVDAAEGFVGSDYNWFGVLGGLDWLHATLTNIAKTAQSLHDKARRDENTPLAPFEVQESLRGFYCSQLIDYCYTKITRKTFVDCEIAQIFPPSALSSTEQLRDVLSSHSETGQTAEPSDPTTEKNLLTESTLQSDHRQSSLSFDT